jgi:diguanylate cyclase (GGDEF)-like protein
MAGDRQAGDCTTTGCDTGYVGLLDTLEDVIDDCIRQDSRMALLVLDYSGIETLLPVLGYRQASCILDTVRTRLQEIKRPSDIFVRIGQQRFALVISDLKFPAMIELLVNKVNNALEGLRPVTGLDVTVNPKTGVALYPEHGRTPEELLLAADTAAQAAFAAGNGLVHAGTPAHDRVYIDKVIESELESAFMRSSFELHYQPKITLASGRLYGAEALIRWNHPEYGMISPDSLVPVIEKSSLLQEITLWVLNTALHQSMSMRERSPDFRIAVNLSPALLYSPDLAELVMRALRIWNTDPRMLILEITETTMMVDQEVSQHNLRQLGEAGVQLSIDDFGTGYSSYAYLQQLQVQELKIDKSFILDLLKDGSSDRLVRSMVNLGRDLGIKVLAEGIESREVLEHLVDMGCEYGQGFFIARPMPYEKMLAWIEASGRGGSPGRVGEPSG